MKNQFAIFQKYKSSETVLLFHTYFTSFVKLVGMSQKEVSREGLRCRSQEGVSSGGLFQKSQGEVSGGSLFWRSLSEVSG
jgi:hypothetical protein